ncbi:hypothetical protein V7150_19075 [Neobacillus drentensis]|uniref:hypothetical protein n=1 Tax=Neobacillus drentensis TaxID=220684 RepID=UPI002FFFB1EA
MINGIFENTALQRNQLQQWEITALEKLEARMKDKNDQFPVFQLLLEHVMCF